MFVEAESRQRTSYLPGEKGHADWWKTRVWVSVGKGVTQEVFGPVTTVPPHSAAHTAPTETPQSPETAAKASAVVFENENTCRNTVARLLELSESPRYERTGQGSKLDPFRGSIARVLTEDAEASSSPASQRSWSWSNPPGG